MKKGVKIGTIMYYENSHLIENNHLMVHINDYKAHLSSLPSQFDKLISIGLNFCIKMAVFSQNYTATARVGKMPAFMSNVHATGVYWHFPEESGISWHILAFPKNIS